jgi:hypothetical protein
VSDPVCRFPWKTCGFHGGPGSIWPPVSRELKVDGIRQNSFVRGMIASRFLGVLSVRLRPQELAKASSAPGGQERFLSAVGQREPYSPRPPTHQAVARFDPVRPPSRAPSGPTDPVRPPSHQAMARFTPPRPTKTYPVRWPNAVSGHVTGFCREMRGFFTRPWSIWPSEVAAEERRILKRF